MKADTVERHEQSVRRVISYIHTNLDAACTVQQLSRVACFAPCHFHRVFRHITGVSVRGYVRGVRLEKALYLLMNTRQSVLEIALNVGYQSNEALTRAFQHAYGVTPSQLRKAISRSCSGRRISPDTLEMCRSALRPSSGSTRRLRGGRVLFRSHFGSYAETRSKWEELLRDVVHCATKGAELTAVGVVYDDPCSADKIRYDMCLHAPRHAIRPGDFGVQVLPAIAEAATIGHRGPPETTIHAYMRLCNAWTLHERKARLERTPYYELYDRIPHVNGDDMVSVQVCVPLARE